MVLVIGVAALSARTASAQPAPASTATPRASAAPLDPPSVHDEDSAPAAAPTRSYDDVLMPLPPASTTSEPAASSAVVAAAAATDRSTRAAPVGSGASTSKKVPAPDASLERMDAHLASIHKTARIWGTVGTTSAHVFLWPYLTSALVGGVAAGCKSGCNSGATEHLPWLLVPGLGPFVTAAFLDDGSNDAQRAVFLVDGALQTVGLTMFITAAVFHRKVRSQLEVDPFGSESVASAGTAAGRHASSMPTIELAPMITTSGGGVLAVGSF